MNVRADTAPPHRRDAGAAPSTGRLAAWLALAGLMIAIAYLSRATEGKPDPQTLYEWSTAIGGLVQDAIVLAVVLAIAGLDGSLLAFRRPVSIRRAIGLIVAAVIAIYAFEIVYGALVHPGNEQGLTPSRWEPAHTAAYITNGVVICTFIPFVEELTFRGLGYSLLERFGRWPAILGVGVVFGLAHGLILSLPVLVVFGCVLAWMRSRTQSVFPGMVLHGTFNLIALVVAVTVHG